MSADVGCLPYVRQEQAGKRESKPAYLDCSHTESSKVGKQSFHACESKQNPSEASPALGLVANEILEGFTRVESGENRIIISRQVVNSKARVEQQPQYDDRRKTCGQFRQAEWLCQEQYDQNTSGGANDGGLGDVRDHHIETLDCPQNRLSRSQDPVRHDHRDSQDSNDFEKTSCKSAVLYAAPKPSTNTLQIACMVSFHLNQGSFAWVSVCNIHLRTN